MKTAAQVLRDAERALDPGQDKFEGPVRITAVFGGNVYGYIHVDAAGASVVGTDGRATNIAVPAKAMNVNDVVPLFSRDGNVFFLR